MPLEDKAPCGDPRSAFGTCCCTCVFHIETVNSCAHQGGTGFCSHSNTVLDQIARMSEHGWACGYFFFATGGPIQVNWEPHGMCEGYSERPAERIRWEAKERG